MISIRYAPGGKGLILRDDSGVDRWISRREALTLIEQTAAALALQIVTEGT
jgi:hypothetical protein